MESQELLELSKEELLSQVHKLELQIQGLDDELSRQNGLMNKVREHKHNYSEDFGLVVSAPVQALVEEVISNPEAFTKDERNRIIKMYANSLEMRGTYECLGWPIGTQLKQVKDVMIPKIRENAKFFSSIVGRDFIAYHNSHLIAILRMALNEVDSLCNNLENIESFEYGISEPFNLKAEVRDAFLKDNSARSVLGETSIRIETYFGDLSDVQVDMNKKNFRTHVLGNIIKNLHDHAFKEIDNSSYDTPILNIRLPLWKKFLSFILPRLSLSAVNPKATFCVRDYFEKKVRIRFVKDENNNRRMNLIIENNGKDFIGDREAVFDKGVGNGSGIGLYSARQFLKHYGANINMLPSVTMDDEYKVGFIINLPIL